MRTNILTDVLQKVFLNAFFFTFRKSRKCKLYFFSHFLFSSFPSSWLSTAREKLTRTPRRNRRRRRKRSRRKTRRGIHREGWRSSRISLWEERRAQVEDEMDHKKEIKTHPPRNLPSPGLCGVERLSSTTKPTP